jgi:hypothetical protein
LIQTWRPSRIESRYCWPVLIIAVPPCFAPCTAYATLHHGTFFACYTTLDVEGSHFDQTPWSGTVLPETRARNEFTPTPAERR